jgi:heme-degrading monooxygenase HmoA
MIKHLVFWRLLPSANGNDSATNARQIKERLEALNGKLPGMAKLEVGIDVSKSEESADVALYSEFESKEALAAYLAHPEHKAVVPFILAARSERRVVDYEV